MSQSINSHGSEESSKSSRSVSSATATSVLFFVALLFQTNIQCPKCKVTLSVRQGVTDFTCPLCNIVFLLLLSCSLIAFAVNSEAVPLSLHEMSHWLFVWSLYFFHSFFFLVCTLKCSKCQEILVNVDGFFVCYKQLRINLFLPQRMKRDETYQYALIPLISVYHFYGSAVNPTVVR